jgi:D-alanyl-D-alanine carboxypeptidase
MKYAVNPCVLLASARHLIPFIVLDIQPCQYNPMLLASAQSSTMMTPQQKGKINKREKKKNAKVNGQETGDGFTNASMLSVVSSVKMDGGLLAEVVVAKESDLGENDISYTVRTHLGHVLQAGDTVLGYDLQHMIFGLEQETKLSSLSYAVPDIILVKKVYPEAERKNRKDGNKKKNRIPPWRRNKQQPAAEGDMAGDDTIVSNIDEEEEGEDGFIYEEDGLEEIEVLEEELLIEEGGEEGAEGGEDEGEWEDVEEEEEEAQEDTKANKKNKKK